MPNDVAQRTYRIADKTFYQTELVWGQVRWLHTRTKGYSLRALEPEHIMELLANELSGILAIILIEAGQTPATKVQAGMDAVRKLEAWLDATLRPEEAVPIMQDFFTSAQLPKLMGELGRMLPKTTVGSSEPSSSSATATPASSPGSSAI